MKKRREFSICPLCDERYDPLGDRAAIHEHPEPQSGMPRDHWRQSGLDYEAWIAETVEGRAWQAMKKGEVGT